MREISAVRQEIFFNIVAVCLEQNAGPAQIADLRVRPLDHAVPLSGLSINHLACAGDLKALFSARLRLHLGHFALHRTAETVLVRYVQRVTTLFVSS